MELRADFTKRVIVHSDQEPWQASPMFGVERRMLDRIGGEVARATTIVRYAPKSNFSAHTHTGGEEYIVLDGVFQDEHGDFPAGTYVRNPPTTSHTPGSDQGCTIFVKLWQFDMADRNQFHVDMTKAAQPTGVGKKTTVLHSDPRETVQYMELAANTDVMFDADGGIELLVLSGTLNESDDVLRKGTWLRSPEAVPIAAKSGPSGAKIWVKSGHLPYAQAPAV